MMKFAVWGMTGTLAMRDATREYEAFDLLMGWVQRLDGACNRFREDSELSLANRRGGTCDVSATFELALSAARDADALTGGMCDPTVLASLEALGYDRDYELISAGVVAPGPTGPAPGRTGWRVDAVEHTLTLSTGTTLDLGATAKALLADLVVAELGVGSLVEIGGDVALSGSGPDGPWVVGVADSLEIRGDEPRVSLASGGLATSSVTARAWRAGATQVHHVIDPRSGRPVSGPNATVTVAAESCVSANALATAGLVWGIDAAWRIARAGASARIVDRDGHVASVGGWPMEAVA
jgi:thiamine biosynthesis lipoprotein